MSPNMPVQPKPWERRSRAEPFPLARKATVSKCRGDLEKSEVCSWDVSPDAPNTLEADDCDVDPDGNSDTFVYRFSGKALIVTGLETNPTLHELITMRFERGSLVSDWREPAPETCNTAPLPRWATSASQVASDWDFGMAAPRCD